MNKERRLLDTEFNSNNEEMIIEGYAITFNSPAKHGYTEIIDSRALDNCDMSDVVLRYNHNDTFQILARTRNHSLELFRDETGLKIRAKLIDTQANRDIYKCITEGLIDKMSFAFTVRADEYDYDTDTRRITDIDKLYDVAVVDVPFYESTSVYARNIDTSNDYLEKRNQLRNEHEDEIKKNTELEEAKSVLLEKLG